MGLYLKASKIFNGLLYFTIGCEVLLFLSLGLSYLTQKGEDPSIGSVMVFLYTGPMLIVNQIIIPYFLILSINRLANKKYNKRIVKEIYKKNAILFIIEIAFAIFANLILLI